MLYVNYNVICQVYLNEKISKQTKNNSERRSLSILPSPFSPSSVRACVPSWALEWLKPEVATPRLGAESLP